MVEEDLIEHFFGVYLLYCINPKYKGRTYIGYTVNPNRRLKQHNAGSKFGGAWKTSNRGPWNMVLIVHGFPNNIAALRFEWAWQNPNLSRRLKHIPKKKSSQTTFHYCLTVLSEMLNTGPWYRLPLTVRWLDEEFGMKYSSTIRMQKHMITSFKKVKIGKIKERKKKKEEEDDNTNLHLNMPCSLCGLSVEENEKICCIKSTCILMAHLICLAEKFCEQDKIIPIGGLCPSCNTNLLWGDLIRKKIGCNEISPDNITDHLI